MPANRRLAHRRVATALGAAVLGLALAPAPAAPNPAALAPAAPDLAAPASAASVAPAGDTATPRGALARQLDDQAASIDRALGAVADKLTGVDGERTHHLAAALRAIRAPGDGAMATARRRAAAGLVLARDLGERALLIDERARLRAAGARVAGDAARLAAIALPTELARPAPGKIARHFGALEHERSHATLSRRGIDIEVEDRAPVTAPASGTVRYAGPIRGLDHGVIIDCGDTLVVVAKLGELALPVGAPIATGDRLGRAARHRVYLEVRVKLGPGGLPIDPEPLLPAPAAAARTR